jgi:enamine deaminase RidA (YjgF/YER057c/UK114 family)
VIFVAGQMGWNEQCKCESGDLVDQIGQTLKNVDAVVRAGGAGPEHIASMTWFLLDRKEYSARLKEMGAAYRDVMGRNFPAMTALQVSIVPRSKSASRQCGVCLSRRPISLNRHAATDRCYTHTTP